MAQARHQPFEAAREAWESELSAILRSLMKSYARENSVRVSRHRCGLACRAIGAQIDEVVISGGEAQLRLRQSVPSDFVGGRSPDA